MVLKTFAGDFMPSNDKIELVIFEKILALSWAVDIATTSKLIIEEGIGIAIGGVTPQ